VTRTDTSAWPCPVARTADLIGEGWTLLIMREACLGVRRFEEFQHTLGLGRNILTLRLNTLVDEGLLTKLPYQERPRRHEYRLTDKGRDVYPILESMAAFGDKWLLGDGDPPRIVRHLSCDHDMHAVVTCSECGQPLDVRNVRVRPGPGYPTDRALPPRLTGDGLPR
jgi:DNA-binding HxlR family transcriptional regulator